MPGAADAHEVQPPPRPRVAIAARPQPTASTIAATAAAASRAGERQRRPRHRREPRGVADQPPDLGRQPRPAQLGVGDDDRGPGALHPLARWCAGGRRSRAGKGTRIAGRP